MSARDIPIFILAGGFGTRLRSEVSDLPKPMAPVDQKPFLEYLLCFHRNNGFNHFVFLTGYLSEAIESYFGDGSEWGVSIKYCVEDKPLGTGGAVRNAVIEMGLSPEEGFYLLNGDTFSNFDISLLHSNDYSSLAVKFLEDTSRYGSVAIGDNKLVEGFVEKSEESGAGFINTGSYFLMAKNLLEVNEETFSLEQVVLPKLVNNKGFMAYEANAEFLDIGIPADYHKCSALFSEVGLVVSENKQ